MIYQEINFNGLPGPTHLFSGLGMGNLASISNEGQVSHPQKAALQSLEKIKFMAQLGSIEAIIPPHRRPYLDILKFYGYSGSPMEQIIQAYSIDPKVFKAIFSSSSMWTANSATVTPSSDSLDKKVHITPANLKSNFHRSFEASANYRIIRKIFKSHHFSVHAPLNTSFPDEGAANHVRLAPRHGSKGIELFVYGDQSSPDSQTLKFQARQSFEASKQITELHKLSADGFLLACQSSSAINAGVFHNDVISTGNENVFIYHEASFNDSSKTIKELKEKYFATCQENLICLEINSQDLSLDDAVSSYFFNSQIISLQSPYRMVLVAPLESKTNTNAKKIIDKIIADSSNPISEVYFFDLNESMKNGGGPACLRLRVVLSEQEQASCDQKFFFDQKLFERLGNWITDYYPVSLRAETLLQTAFYENLKKAFDELELIFEVQL
jgi:succinylarginine dihydrolase